MEAACLHDPAKPRQVEPLCPVFGSCGGCLYQDIPYEEELRIKEESLRRSLSKIPAISERIFRPIVPSPKEYHYRYRLDIGIYQKRDGEIKMGFRQEVKARTVPVDSCAIAHPRISEFLPTLKEQAQAILPSKYHTANLVVRTGDDGRVRWGGIGRHSLCMREEDYFYTDIGGKRIHYALDTFFQANLSILPHVLEYLRSFHWIDAETTFLDLYAGVGLFGLLLADLAGEVILIEDCEASVRVARYNIAYHQLEEKAKIFAGRVDAYLPPALREARFAKRVAMIDPPRKGLSVEVVQMLCDAACKQSGTEGLQALFYLSCSPDSLARDLTLLTQEAWQIDCVIPFDFFPKTQHLETLVLLLPRYPHE
jgi:23S rRNA (uracil1939-C5)-methyltransferase/tRNA (uracil-5-)-methyltransferase